MGVVISYQLAGHGWADCTVSINDARVTISASYISHALEDLAAAVVAAMRGHPLAKATFDEEPGEYRWTLEQVVDGEVQVRILEFAQLRGGRPDSEGKVLLSEKCRLRTFAGALLSELQRIDREVGRKGYREKWVLADFPAARMEELEGLLAEGGVEQAVEPDGPAAGKS
jgi:hypothetical protein